MLSILNRGVVHSIPAEALPICCTVIVFHEEANALGELLPLRVSSVRWLASVILRRIYRQRSPERGSVQDICI